MNTIRGSKYTPDAGQAEDDFKNVDPFVLRSCYNGPLVQYSYGVSIYFPWAKVPADLDFYRKLYFAKNTKWVKFLDSYLDETQRPARNDADTQKIDYTKAQGRQYYQLTANSFFGPMGFRSNLIGKSGFITRFPDNLIGTMRNPPIDYNPCPCDEPILPNGNKTEGTPK